MKKLLLSLAIVAGVSIVANAVNLPGDITWYSGSWAYKVPIADNLIVTSLGQVDGVIEGCTDLIVPDPFGEDPSNPGIPQKLTITGPGNYGTRQVNIYKMTADPSVTNSFQFRFNSTSAPERTPGEYVVTFPTACMYVDGTANTEFQVTFHLVDNTVYTPVDIAYTVSPVDGLPLETLEAVKFTFSSVWDTDQIVNGSVVSTAGSERYAMVGVNPSTTATFTNVATGEVIPCSGVSTASSTSTLAFKISPETALTTPGQYRLDVPQDYFRLQEVLGSSVTNVCNKALSYTFIIAGEEENITSLKPTPTPAPGQVASLTKIEFSKPGTSSFYVPQSPKAVTLTLPDGTTQDVVPTSNPNVEGDMAFLNLGTTYSDPGDYTFSFPKGCWEFVSGSTVYISEAYTLTYTVVATEAVDMAYTASPADGSEVYNLSFVYLVFDEPVEGVTGIKPLCFDPDGDPIENASLGFNPTLNRLMVDLKFPTEYGQYTITIPEGAVKNEQNQVNTPITLHIDYVAREVVDVPFTVSPEEGQVTTLSVIDITVPSTYESAVLSDGGLTPVQFTLKNGETWRDYLSETADPLKFQVEIRSVAEGRPDFGENAEVNMIIPEGTFRLTRANGVQELNALAVYSWEISGAGVNLVEWAKDASYDVYTLDGINVLKGASLRQVTELRGVYVVNGKRIKL